MRTVEWEVQSRVGWLIRNHREDRRMTQHELARLAGISRSRISDYELGKVDIPISQLWKIARALGMPLSDFLQYQEVRL